MADTFLPETLFETEDPVVEETEKETSLTEEMLRRILDDNRQANERLITQVTQRGVPLQKEEVAPELAFSIEGLPDPSLDPAAFHKEYTARAAKALQTALGQHRTETVRETQQVVSDAQLRDRADAMIKAAAPGLDDEMIGYASGVVAGRLRAQGLDPMAALRGNLEAVVQDIVDYTDEMATKLAGSRRPPQEGEGRTRGLVAPRPRAPRAQVQKQEGPGDFAKELAEFQRKARIY